MANVNAEQIRAARRTDLYQWIERNANPFEFKKEGNSFRPIFNLSISIKRGFSGYKDFSTDETGNSVDFLVKYMNYDLVTAVQSLLGLSAGSNTTVNTCTVPVKKSEPIVFQLPEPVQGTYKQLFAYLNQTRRIPAELIQRLIHEQRIYQEAEHNNIVFVNPKRNFAELHGTTTLHSFHGVVAASSPTDFWWFRSGPHVERAYICEAAIDAMSLYVIHRYLCEHARTTKDFSALDRFGAPALYVSIAGVANKQRIDAVREGLGMRPVYLAVDNDDAGQKLRDAYKGVPYVFELIPEHKDWNEDLCSLIDGWEQQDILFNM